MTNDVAGVCSVQLLVASSLYLHEISTAVLENMGLRTNVSRGGVVSASRIQNKDYL